MTEHSEELLGILIWFAHEPGKNFGVLKTTEKKEYFLHHTKLKVNLSNVAVGSCYVFNPSKDKKKAYNVRLANTSEDFNLALSFLGTEANVLHSDRFSRFTYNIINKVFKQYAANTDEKQLKLKLESIKNDALVLDNFIQFAEALKVIHRINDISIDEYLLSIYDLLSSELKFMLWYEGKTNFIGLSKAYVPQADIFISNLSKLDVNAFRRLLRVSDQNELIVLLIKKLLQDKPDNTYNIFQFLIAENELDIDHGLISDMKSLLFNLFMQNIKDEVDSRTLKSKEDLLFFIKKIESLPPFINNEENKQIKELFQQRLDIPKQFKFEAWISDLTNEYNYKYYKECLLSDDYSDKSKFAFISKLEQLDHLDLPVYLEEMFDEKGFRACIKFVNNYTKEVNNTYREILKSNLFDESFWLDKGGRLVVPELISLLETKTNDEEKTELFFDGYLKEVSYENLKAFIPKMNKGQLNQSLNLKSISIVDKNQIICTALNSILEEKSDEFTSKSKIVFLYQAAHEKLDEEKVNAIDEKFTPYLDPAVHYGIWQKNHTTIVPIDYFEKAISDLVTHSDNSILIGDIGKSLATIASESSWLESLILNKIDLINSKVEITSNLNFIINTTHIINEFSEIESENFKFSEEGLFTLSKWLVSDELQIVNTDLLQSYYYYLLPKYQNLAVQKLFACKESRIMEFELDTLENILSESVDSQSNEDLNISLDIVVKALRKFSNSGEFLIPGDLFKLVYESLDSDRSKKVLFDDYFERCQGRSEYKFNLKTRRKIFLDKDKTQFIIDFDYNAGTVAEVKKLPQRSFDVNTKRWIVPYNQRTRTAVYEFMTENRFKLEYENGKPLSNNRHLANEILSDVPNGRTFCDGRKGKSNDVILNKPFWWCNNAKCFRACQTHNTANLWKHYTILDFARILDFNMDSLNSKGELIKNGHYLKFMSHINRFQQLQEKLYCTNCNDILYPKELSNFSFYTVTRFKCRNEDCPTCVNEDLIYLNHCFNGHCNAIIDSRVSRKCPNGLYICESCGCCCSQEFFKRRSHNLKINEAYNAYVEGKYQARLGHLDKEECYCHIDGEKMYKVGEGFGCNCGNSYNIKRPKITGKDPLPFLEA